MIEQSFNQSSIIIDDCSNTITLEGGLLPARDANGQPPYLLASTKATRNAFRQFVGEFPDSSNFAETQVRGDVLGDTYAVCWQRKSLTRLFIEDCCQEKMKMRQNHNCDFTAIVFSIVIADDVYL